MTDPQWEHSTVLSGPLAEEITRLKEQEGRDIVVSGSIQLAHGLIAAGLVDEFRLFVYPVVLGTGARLFQGATQGSDLELVETRRFNGGIVLTTYRVRTP